VQLRLFEVDTEAGTRAVQNRDIDIALVRRASGGPGYRAAPLRHGHFAAVLPLDHPHAVSPADDRLDLGELATQPWVWIPRDISPGYTTKSSPACRQAGFSPDARHQANSIATQLAMVSCGIGVAIVPSLAASTRQDLAVRPLRDPAPLVALSLLLHKDSDPSSNTSSPQSPRHHQERRKSTFDNPADRHHQPAYRAEVVEQPALH